MTRLAHTTVIAALVTSLVATPALAFDTYWHSAASAGAGTHYKFSPDAVNILQFGTFGPDFFGPLFDKAGEHIDALERAANDFMGVRDKATGVRTAGQFMHFDNLSGELNVNWKFDYVWLRLLDNTSKTIAAFNANPKLNDGTKKLLTLVTLGSSLHMLEDFYSHTDWTHFDFVALGFPQQKNEWGQDYAPSWFTVRAKLGAPALDGHENWAFSPSSGIYPPPTGDIKKNHFGTPMSHDHFNHDNAALFYAGESQVPFHNFGAHPAKNQDTAADHQLYAVSSAAVAAVEWVGLLEKSDKVKAAIDGAKDWDLQKFNPAMQRDLESGLTAILMFSCLVKKWDGDKAPPARTAQCGLHVALPTVFNEFWASYIQYNILEKLTDGIGGATGHYTFDHDWLLAHDAQP